MFQLDEAHALKIVTHFLENDETEGIDGFKDVLREMVVNRCFYDEGTENSTHSSNESYSAEKFIEIINTHAYTNDVTYLLKSLPVNYQINMMESTRSLLQLLNHSIYYLRYILYALQGSQDEDIRFKEFIDTYYECQLPAHAPRLLANYESDSKEEPLFLKEPYRWNEYALNFMLSDDVFNRNFHVTRTSNTLSPAPLFKGTPRVSPYFKNYYIIQLRGDLHEAYQNAKIYNKRS